MDVFFEKTFQVTTREEERFGRLRPSALLAFMQDAAAGAAIALNVGREQLVAEHGAFWMLTRVWFQLKRPIRLWENLTIRTWHRGNKGVLMYRDFDFYVDGEPVGEAVSVWVLANISTHEVMRLSVLGELKDSTGGSLMKSKTLSKIKMPGNLALDEVRRMHNSDLDVNAHVNNTRYADFAEDSAHVENLTEDRFIESMTIGYVKELRAGEELSLLTAWEGDICWVRGAGGRGEARFDAQIVLGKTPKVSAE